MAIEIRLQDRDAKPYAVLDAVRKALDISPFEVRDGFEVKSPKRNAPGGTVVLTTIRLKHPKDYCGNHPGPCLVENGREHRKSRCMEGGDWVQFNDLLNDVLDRMNVSANFQSSHVVMRKGRNRRVNYDMHDIGRDGRIHMDWVKVGEEDDYADFCGKVAPASTYPNGTPGLTRADMTANQTANTLVA